jgi:transcriptional regulator with XRE-family HTH domain
MTQVALADAAGISQSYIADLDSGRRSGSPRQLAAVAAALKVPLDLLAS